MKSAAGTCPFCNQKAGILSSEHPDCRRTYQAGWNEMVELAAHAAKPHEFPANSLRVPLTEIAKPSHGDARYSRTGTGKRLEKGAQTRRRRQVQVRICE